MCDILHFNVEDRRKHMHCSNAIAFYPSDGFMIFEGYSYAKPSDLPMKMNIYRTHSQIELCNYYTVEVQNVWKKDLQSRPKTEAEVAAELKRRLEREEILNESGFCPDCCCRAQDCECDMHIQFFPQDIIIVEFKVLESNHNKKDIIDKCSWDYCIDGRYSSNTDLLMAYKGLLDLPEDTYQSYTPRAADREFYVGYYDNLDKCSNICDMPLDKLIPICTELEQAIEQVRLRART